MGAGSSKYAKYGLTSYAGNPLAIVGSDHVHKDATPLRVYVSGDAVCDASGLIHYHIDRHIGSTSWSITIKDAYLDPVCNMSTKVGGLLAENFSVYRGGSSEDRVMKVVGHKHMNSYEFEVKLASGDMLTVKIQVSDPSVYVFSGHPKNGGFLIARSSLGGSMRAEIAQGVDVPAISMLLALASEVVSALRRTGRAARRHGH